MRQITSVFIVSLLIINSLASAKTYHVSTVGKDTNSGTIAEPWSTWGHAFIKASAGDTVYFRGGIYYTTVKYTVSSVGTKNDPICFFNYPGEVPVLDGINKTSSSDGIYILYANHIKFRGLTVLNMRQLTYNANLAGFAIAWSNNITFENCTAHDIGFRGFYIYEPDSLYFYNCDAFNCIDRLSDVPGNHGDGFIVWDNGEAEDTTSYVIFKNCRSWHNADDGWDAETEGYIELDNCWAFNNGLEEFKVGGNGFKIGLTDIESSNLARKMNNCIGAFNRGAGFTTNDNECAGKFMQIYNNIAYHNGHDGDSYNGWGFAIENTYSSDTQELKRIFKNNISYVNETLEVLASGSSLYTHDHNSWDIPITITDTDFTSVDSTGITGPRQADGSFPELKFLKLAPTSNLIDLGTEVGLPFSGAAPDLGYSEFLPGSAAIINPVYINSVIQNASPTRLEMTYSLTLANIIPASSAFTVKVNSITRTVSSVSISSAKVLLTLSSPVVYGDMVTVAYTKPVTNPIQTLSGGLAETIIAHNVINNCSVPTVNQSPSVSISSPTKSTAFISPATITIDATAFDPDGTIIKVEYYNGATKLGERTAAPYSYSWKEVPEGIYSLTAAAIDNLNAKTVSAPVSVTVVKSAAAVNQIPAVSISSPGNNSTFQALATITFTAVASDNDGSINKVEYFKESIKIGESSTAPYAFSYEFVDTGSFEVIAVATDNMNAIASSSPVKITVTLKNEYPDMIKLFPNPNNGRFTVDMFTRLLNDQNNRITIVSLTGKSIYYDIMAEEETTREFDLSGIAPGTYILIITSGNKVVTTKEFIKK